ncbi:MAG: diguanylate cyclase [Rhodospirillales bacterium]|nr:diguanylate cyclase [Rhodospirillales bacterium]
MAEDASGPAAPIVSVRPGRNRLPDEDRALLEARRKRQQNQERGRGGAGGQGGHEDIQDDVSVLGIPKAEMTESVRAAIELLLDEINHLRAELVHAHGHEAYLEEQAEKDRLLHVMRRRAFLARIALAARRVMEEQVQFSFIYIAVANAAAVRTQFGHGAAENLMMQAAAVLRDNIEPGDVVGSLEQFDFGVLLPGTPIADAADKALKLVQGLNGRTFIWQGAEVTIEGVFGVAEVAPLDSGDELILRAKRDKDARKSEGGQEAR